MISAAALAWLAPQAASQPSISPGGVVNAASYAPAGLPNSAIAQGSIFVIFGRNLGPAQLAQASFPLPTWLAGTSVRVSVGGQNVDCYMIYTSAGQVAALLPSRTPVGTGTITVTYNNQTSAPAPITVAQTSFGIFTVSQAGMGPGVITDANYQPALITRPGRRGQVMILWGTGLGPVAADVDERNPGAPVRDIRPPDFSGACGRSPGAGRLCRPLPELARAGSGELLGAGQCGRRLLRARRGARPRDSQQFRQPARFRTAGSLFRPDELFGG